MAAGSAVIANDPNNEWCSYITDTCSPADTATPWAIGVAAAAFAGLQR